MTGYVARAAAPQVSFQIGQYFKGTNGEGTAPHILAHGILAAAVSYATGNDVTTGALSAMGAEATAKPLAQYLFGKSDLSALTADQKQTVSSITSLAGVGLGASTGSVTNAVSAGENGKVAVQNNIVFFDQLIAKAEALVKKETSSYKSAAAKGAVEGVTDIGIGVLHLFNAVGDTTSMAVNCNNGNQSACDKAVEANQARGYAIGNFLISIGNGDLGREILQSYEDLASGDPDKVAKAQETQIRIFTTIGLGASIDKLGQVVPKKIPTNTVSRTLSNSEISDLVTGKKSSQKDLDNYLGKTTTCSFRGDMLIETQTGYVPIADIKIGDMVLAKNEFTGQVSYQKVLNQYNNPYKQTVYVTVKDRNGNKQTIVSNKIHPYFTHIDNQDNSTLPPSSEGHNYQGEIKNAQWVDASNLKAGYELLSEDGKWQIVQHIEVKDEPLSAYNLTVDNDHTYFIAGNYKVRGVWVHNDCLLPKSEELWAHGSPNEDALANVTKHFEKHKNQVGAKDIEQYMRKAEGFKQNLRGAKQTPVDGYNEGVTRYSKNGKYIDLTADGKIVSFGSSH